MEIRYLLEFLTLLELKSYSKAAEELIMSQPTLTKHIQSMEREIGGKLFDRSTREIRLSPLGEVFLPYAKTITREYERLENSMHSFQRSQKASFTIGVVRNLQYYDVIGFLVAFRKKYPDCMINVTEVEDYRLKGLLMEGKLNMITAAFPMGSSSTIGNDTEFVEIGKGFITAALPENFNPTTKGVSLKEVAKYPLIIPERSSLFSRMIRASFKNEGLEPNIIYEGSSAGCMDFTKAGMGISLQAKEVVEGHKFPGMISAPVVPKIEYHYGLLHKTNTHLNKWEKRFVSFIESQGRI